MKSTTWFPAAIRVDEAVGFDILALVLEDDGETVMIPLAGGDARRIGAALLGVEIPAALDLDETPDLAHGHGTFDD